MGIGCSEEKRAKLSASMKRAIALKRENGEMAWGRRKEQDYSARVERRLKIVAWQKKMAAWQAAFGAKESS